MNLLLALVLFCTAVLADESDNFFADDSSGYDEDVANQKIDDNYDPLESFNRKVFDVTAFGTKYLILPVAKFYGQTVPRDLQPHIRGMTQNVSALVTLPNALLIPQKPLFVKSLFRLTTNTAFGFFGFFDIYSRYDDDRAIILNFDAVVQYYNDKSLPYLFLPWGPSNIFGAAGFVSQIYVRNQFPDYLWYVAAGDIIMNSSANYNVLYDGLYNSVDPYSVTRNVYYGIQRGHIANIRSSRYNYTKYTDLLPKSFL